MTTAIAANKPLLDNLWIARHRKFKRQVPVPAGRGRDLALEVRVRPLTNGARIVEGLSHNLASCLWIAPQLALHEGQAAVTVNECDVEWSSRRAQLLTKRDERTESGIDITDG